MPECNMPTQTAILLVAGVGARLRPLTNDRPKALVDLGGETIFGRALRLLKAYGVRRFVFATGFGEEALRAHADHAKLDYVCARNPNYETTQNAVSFALCKEHVKQKSFFKLDGDVVFHSEVLRRLDASSAPLAVAVDEASPFDTESMKVSLDSGQQIRRFSKNMSAAESGGESIGIERVQAACGSVVFEALEAEMRSFHTHLYYEDVYTQLLERRALSAEAIPVGDLPWVEVDTPLDLDRARDLQLQLG